MSSDRYRPLVDELSGPETPRLVRLDRAAADLRALSAPPAKPGPVSATRDRWNEAARLRFVAAVDKLDQFGWSWDRIALYLECTKVHVIRIYKGHGRVMAYMLDRLDELPELECLPACMRVEQLRKVV